MNSVKMTLQPARPIEPAYAMPEAARVPLLRLDRNEGPRCDDGLIEALRALTTGDLQRYTTPSSVERTLAECLGVDADRLLITAGGDDAIDRACRIMLREGLSAVVPVPTFEMIPRGVHRTGATLVEIDWMDGAFPAASVIDAVSPQTRLISIVSPNNPTGLIARPQDVVAVCAAAPNALVLVDLAYAEFADVDLFATVLAQPNAVAVRTFSKAYGLAGLRVGFAAGSPGVIAWLRSIGSPYPCSSASLAVAGRMLERGLMPDPAYIQQVRQERASLSDLLCESGWRVWPSQGNFVLAQANEALRVCEMLTERGIAVRSFPDSGRLDHCLRITCPGNCNDFNILITSLGEVLTTAKESINV